MKMSLDLEVLIASMVSSFALHLLHQKDMNLIKILVYPRAIEAVYSLLKEKGYVKPIPYGETLSHMINVIIVVQLYMFEPKTVDPSFEKSLDSYMNYSEGEKHMVSILHA